MKTKRLITVALGVLTCAALAVGLAACGKVPSGSGGERLTSKDVYALSAVSSVSYLQGVEAVQAKAAAATRPMSMAIAVEGEGDIQAARPGTLTDADVEGVGDCLKMFEDILAGGEVSQTTAANPETEGEVGAYAYVMTISIPSVSGNISLKMYYNETNIEIETDDDDDDDDDGDDAGEEIEISSTLEGIIISGEDQFEISGKKEIETEDGETEMSIEFTTKSKANPLNYITVSQSVEEDELEYEYKIYENGKKVLDVELEIENDDDGLEVEFQLKEISNGSAQKTRYKITKDGDDDAFKVKFSVDGTTDSFKVEKEDDGYKFIYSNGYVETVR